MFRKLLTIGLVFGAALTLSACGNSNKVSCDNQQSIDWIKKVQAHFVFSEIITDEHNRNKYRGAYRFFTLDFDTAKKWVDDCKKSVQNPNSSDYNYCKVLLNKLVLDAEKNLVDNPLDNVSVSNIFLNKEDKVSKKVACTLTVKIPVVDHSKFVKYDVNYTVQKSVDNNIIKTSITGVSSN